MSKDKITIKLAIKGYLIGDIRSYCEDNFTEYQLSSDVEYGQHREQLTVKKEEYNSRDFEEFLTEKENAYESARIVRIYG